MPVGLEDRMRRLAQEAFDDERRGGILNEIGIREWKREQWESARKFAYASLIGDPQVWGRAKLTGVIKLLRCATT